MQTLQTHFAVLDIETSYESIDGKPAISWLSFGRIKVYDLKLNPVFNKIFREWNELIFILREIERKFYNYLITCYCHNLAFEFDFIIKNISKPDKILSNSSHGIISGTIENFNFNFKCSYKLSGYSLKKIGEMVGLEKLEADYINIYPKEEIPQNYLIYNERDCDIVAKYIVEIELKKYGKIKEIPYTKTGKVRKKFKEFYRIYNGKGAIWDLMPDNNCYEALTNSFQGAITISNPLFTNIELLNVHSYDIKSSYPYSMLKEEFPYTIKKSEDISKERINEKFWIAKIKFTNIKSKYSWNWINISKLQLYDKQNSKFFNGKLINADYIVRTLTNVDFELIKDTYDFEDYEILEFYELTEYNTLPKAYIDTILYYAEIKEENGKNLKNAMKKGYDEQTIHELEREYMLSKNDLNSIFGMSVQRLVQPEYKIDENFIWHEIEQPYRQQKNVHMKRNFLYGIYILAYARRNLIRAILENCPLSFVYADTDSIKFIGENNFTDTNEKLDQRFLELSYIKNLGKFEYELTYDEFKVLGAKKYSFITNNQIHITVAGLPKGANKKINKIEDFKPETMFENCKLAKAYINNQCCIYCDWENEEILEYTNNTKETEEFIEKHNIITNGGVVLYPTSYYLDMTMEDKLLVKEYQKSLPYFLEKNENLRSYFKYGKSYC